MQSGSSGQVIDENERLARQSNEIIGCCMSFDEEWSAEKVQKLIEAKADVNKTNKRGQLPLHKAVYHNRLDIVSILIDAKADVTKKDPKDHSSALIEASLGSLECRTREMMETCSKIMRMLVDAKADVNHEDLQGRTAAHLICKNVTSPHLPLLVELKADLFLQNKHGKTSYDIAKLHSHVFADEIMGRILLSQTVNTALSNLLINDLIKIVTGYMEDPSAKESEKIIQSSLKR